MASSGAWGNDIATSGSRGPVLNVALNRLLGVALVQRALILGVDAGLTMTKAALFDEEGREVAAVSARSEISHPRPG